MLAVVIASRIADGVAAAESVGLTIPVVDEANVLRELPPVRVPGGDAKPVRASECAVLYTSGTRSEEHTSELQSL